MDIAKNEEKGTLEPQKQQVSRKPRGFGALPESRRKEIAARGGRAAHQKGTAHEFLPGDPATIEAGKKGGKIVAARPGHMARIGAIGGTRGKGRERQRDVGI